MEAITATYVERDDDWSVTVAGMGQELTEHAPGIIAARDQAEQLIDSLKPEQGETAVVHLLHGSALDFTTAYMTARLGRTGDSGTELEDGFAIPEQASGEQEAEEETAATDTDDAVGTPDAKDADDSGETVDGGTVDDAEADSESAQELAK